MTQLFIFLNLEEIIGKGGLFDFGITLPLLMAQFILLTFVLNIILYQPILNTINERNEYLLNNLTTASNLLYDANLIAQGYELDLQIARKKIQRDLLISEAAYKQIWELELQMIQNECDLYVKKYNDYLLIEKEKTLKILEEKIDSLSVEILGKLFI